MSKFKIVKTIKEVKELIQYCKQTGYASVDFETTSLEYYEPDQYPTILGVSFQPGSAWIIPLGHFDSPFKKGDKWIKILKLFGREVMQDWDIVKIAWNFKFEYKWFLRYGIMPRGRLFDSQLAKYTLDEERPNDLKSWVDKLFPAYGHYEDENKRLVNKHGWAGVPLEPLAKYCGIDCDMTFRLYLYFERRMIKLGFYNLFRNLLMMSFRVLAESEYHGMVIDKPYLEELVETYKVKIAACQNDLDSQPALRKFNQVRRKRVLKRLMEEVSLEIDEIADSDKPNAPRLIASRQKKISGYNQGVFNNKEAKLLEPLNWASPAQVIDFFYKSKSGLNLPVIKYTMNKKTKKESTTPSTDEDTLERLLPKDKTGTLASLLTYRGLTKLDSTYVTGMRNIMGTDDRVHPNFKIFGTVTGRLSCEKPNLQNIPRGTTSSDIKKMFIPPPGYVWLEVDYSQAELRVVAELAGDVAMIEIFKKNYNIHVATACKVNGGIQLYDQVKSILKDDNHPDWLFWEKQKKRAKLINFGILYGQTEKKLSRELECTEEEASEFIRLWLGEYPQVAKWIKKQKKYAHEHGYVISLFGRKRRLYNIYSEKYGVMLEAERQAVNTPIQGTASDFGLLSQVVTREMKMRVQLPKDLTQCSTVHDSIVFYCKPEDVHKVVPVLIKVCDNPNTLPYFGFEMKDVKMKIAVEVGKLNGFDKHDYDPWMNYTSWATPVSA